MQKILKALRFFFSYFKTKPSEHETIRLNLLSNTLQKLPPHGFKHR